MYKFFDPTEYSDIRIPMYGSIHLVTLGVMMVLLVLLLCNRDLIRRWVSSRRSLVIFTSVYLGIELFYWILQWAYRVEPAYERIPLHLCGTLSLLMPVLILTDRDDLLRFFSYWSVSAGFISFINPGFVFQDPWSFSFMHYLIRHYLLFAMPIILQIGRDYRHTYREFTKSWTILAAWAFVIFLLDWATGANYMHLGRNNPLAIPFLPAGLTVWPWTFPSFVAVGIVLLHLSYFGFLQISRGERSKKAIL